MTVIANAPSTAVRLETLSDPELVAHGVEQFSRELMADLAGESEPVRRMVEAYDSVLHRGGKRTRGNLAVLGYAMLGGADKHVASVAAGAVEGLHAGLLVIDDVEDSSLTRRGGPTAHVMIEQDLKDQGAQGDTTLKARDLATGVGLYVQNKAQTMITDLDEVPAEWRLRTIKAVNREMMLTGVGQLMDVFSTTALPLTREQIEKVALYKTAYYSFLMPLEAGALLAGAEPTDLGVLEDYSLPAGKAFQLHDDVMGVYGDEVKMGKSPKSDIIEGKQTLLIDYAMEAATPAERAMLTRALGNGELSDTDFAVCQEIIERTGARARVSSEAQSLAQQAQDALANAPESWAAERVQQLHSLATFITARSV
ncbi:MAG TPA: polyprenyl synthetase family protein [Candidatus Saccharimonadales bacterium]